MRLDRELILMVVHPEDNWHQVLDEDGEATGNLIVNDLGYLKTYELYWLNKLDSGVYNWEAYSVPAPKVNRYLREYHNGESDDDECNFIMFVNDSSKKFNTWFECLNDLAHHVAFSYGGVYPLFDNNVCMRFSRSFPFRVFCEPYILDLIRCNKNVIENDNYQSFSFSRVYDFGLMGRLVEKFGPKGT